MRKLCHFAFMEELKEKVLMKRQSKVISIIILIMGIELLNKMPIYQHIKLKKISIQYI